MRGLALALLFTFSCGGKKAPTPPETPAAVVPQAAPTPGVATPPEPKPTEFEAPKAVVNSTKFTMPTPEQAIRAGALQCNKVPPGQPIAGPDCVTSEITCGQTVIGHTKGGVERYDTRWYERNTCWPGTRNHSGGDERVYMFNPAKSPRFQAGEQRQRVTVTFDSPCADLTFTHILGSLNQCPGETTRICDSANPFTRKNGRSTTNITVDAGEVYYFLVEGADDAEGAFAVHLECGT